jgi:alkyldihydroxyacetonephosphate synthase
MTRPSMPNDYPASSVAGPIPDALSGALLDDLNKAGIDYETNDATRAQHGRDWWPLTIGDVAKGLVPSWPGIVVRPTSSEQVSRVLASASMHGIAVTAQGGRSSVVGGALAPTGAIALDMTGLDSIGAIDTESGLVSVDAGVFGPELEQAVGDVGWTVGHFPQSFALATVGGWIACRGAGQFSNRYGKIEDIVRGLTVVLANGDVIEVGGRAPRQAVGPDLMQLFVGSEGTLGIITRATLVMHPVARSRRSAAYGFATFEDGLESCRRILQRDARPAVLRLYDEVESKRSFDEDQCTLIVLDEGDELLVDATMTIVATECAQATVLDPSLVTTWLDHRNDVGALGPLWERGFVVDTIEVAGSWSTLASMHHKVIAALRELPDVGVASVHQSHAYLDGACLYFTFAGRPTSDPTAFYRAAWDAVTYQVMASGGAISHHHGIGRNRARFVPDALGTAYPVLTGIKALLDPRNILNPGALGIGGAPW